MTVSNEPKSLGIIGAAILAIGCFMPILSMPIVGNMTYIQNGGGDGVIVLIAAGAGAFFSHKESRKGMLASGFAAAGVMLITLINIQMKISEFKTAMAGEMGMFSGLGNALAQSIQLQWGWAVLGIGAGLLIHSGFKTKT